MQAYQKLMPGYINCSVIFLNPDEIYFYKRYQVCLIINSKCIANQFMPVYIHCSVIISNLDEYFCISYYECEINTRLMHTDSTSRKLKIDIQKNRMLITATHVH